MNEHILQLLYRAGQMRLGPLMHERGVHLPCYPDIRALYARPHYLRLLTSEFAMRIERERIDLFAGVPLGGYPLAVSLAMFMNRPFICVRPPEKHSPHRQQLEGSWRKGQRVAIVDDTLILGKAKKRAAELIAAEKMKPTHILTIMEVGGFPAWSSQRRWIQERGIKTISLVTWHEWIHFLEREGQLSKEVADSLLKLVEHPPEWTKD